MDKKWRPEGWTNPYYSHNYGNALMSMSEALNEPYKHKAYEAGADAMLEALRKRVVLTSNTSASSYPGGETFSSKPFEAGGKWVFIPDDEV